MIWQIRLEVLVVNLWRIDMVQPDVKDHCNIWWHKLLLLLHQDTDISFGWGAHTLLVPDSGSNSAYFDLSINLCCASNDLFLLVAIQSQLFCRISVHLVAQDSSIFPKQIYGSLLFYLLNSKILAITIWCRQLKIVEQNSVWIVLVVFAIGDITLIV